ncbi:hypothetical protein NEFER03_1775 [Nematocida sp. LUAm3]|nr:hypothetical protein NEFER03_1775 [Nematocida sp. LUAm3]KAI5173918.1 hypothetical protein NEFER02_0385 [Nematocida sp. LUAm2]KAI5177337.1 hypothetical protein NEFER01_0612 [Nematocida sp. LUAm1]
MYDKTSNKERVFKEKEKKKEKEEEQDEYSDKETPKEVLAHLPNSNTASLWKNPIRFYICYSADGKVEKEEVLRYLEQRLGKSSLQKNLSLLFCSSSEEKILFAMDAFSMERLRYAGENGIGTGSLIFSGVSENPLLEYANTEEQGLSLLKTLLQEEVSREDYNPSSELLSLHQSISSTITAQAFLLHYESSFYL